MIHILISYITNKSNDYQQRGDLAGNHGMDNHGSLPSYIISDSTKKLPRNIFLSRQALKKGRGDHKNSSTAEVDKNFYLV